MDRPDHHRAGTYPLEHHPVTSVSGSGPGRFPLGLRLYRRDEALTLWEAAVATPVPDRPIPRERKARQRRHTQVAPVRLQDPAGRARPEPLRTTIALAVDLSEEAIRHNVPCAVVGFDAWDLAADVGRVLARRRQDGSRLLNTNRRREPASVQLRDAHGGALQRPGPHLAGADRVPLLPAHASRAVTVQAQPSGGVTRAVRLPGLGQMRIVVSCATEPLTGRSVVLVTNRVDWHAAKIIRLDGHRWPAASVATPMTKRRGFSLGAGGHHVAHLHLVVGDDDMIDAPFHQWSALGKAALVQGRVYLPTKGFESLGQRGEIHLWLRLGVELTQWLGQAVWGLGHLLSCALERVTPKDLGQGDLQPAGVLPVEVHG